MRLKRWIPWNFLLRRAARRYDLIDPVNFLARLRRFAQPSEVQEPIELLRAGIVFHARGLVNTKAIQFNLDWVWPYWVERQFNPGDPSFIPRGFSFSHVNLTHRNWTAAGLPDIPLYPIVDPRGLVTPRFDGWSLDFWIIAGDGGRLLPSKLDAVDQCLELAPTLAVRTRMTDSGLGLETSVRLEAEGDEPQVVVEAVGSAPGRAWLAVCLRPYNPEGIQFIESIGFNVSTDAFTVNDSDEVRLGEPPERVAFSDYKSGDVLRRLPEGFGASVTCPVGMATAAALYPIPAGGERAVHCAVPVAADLEDFAPTAPRRSRSWHEVRSGTAELTVPDERIGFLFEAARHTLIMLSAADAVPGPYTYRRFWFRDAALMINALLALGLAERSARLLASFPDRQRASGYFRSQEGEWDSNGQVLWIVDRYQQLTREELSDEMLRAVVRGAGWIERKRIANPDHPRHGLLPAGFSAEHLGANDYYYWDDFWGIAGLLSAARLATRFGREQEGRRFLATAMDFESRVLQTIDDNRLAAIPAAPGRRMDSGAVGSLVADYPLALLPADDERVAATAEYLLADCFYDGGFFQDMIHSGINAYLTLAVAQTLLRRGDPRARELVDTVARLASPTGQWPEAIHPRTGGGCMGDGQHGWAAAEWVMIVRNSFIREEPEGLVLGSGVFPEWLAAGSEIGFGPTLTPYGPAVVRLRPRGDEAELLVEADWHGPPPELAVRVPGWALVAAGGGRERFILKRDHS